MMAGTDTAEAGRRVLRLVSDFPDRLARRGLTIRAFARQYGVNETTIHVQLNPERRGAMRPKTAWDIARAFAAVVGCTPEEAYAELIIEERAA